MASPFTVAAVPTSPIDGQKTGTSGLRKKVVVFQQPNYLHNWVQSLFSGLEGLAGSTIALGGDGRYWNKDAIRIILRLAAANGVSTVKVGHNGIICTPAMSAIIRADSLYGGIILTASHNPGGPTNDFGIKYNVSNGGPAPESVTSVIFKNTKTISEYKMAVVSEEDTETDPFASVDLSVKGSTTFSNSSTGSTFTVEVIDSADAYVTLLQSMFDFNAMRNLFARPDFSFLFDAMNGVTGPYADRIFVELLGGPLSCVMRGVPLEDFGGGHPDPNLTYAAELVEKCDPTKNPDAPDLGAASDGDGDRNMVLGKGFFVTPSDSVALIAAKSASIPYFKGGLKGVARSMPTGGALDRVAADMGIELHEVPTGWKYFGNLMDAGRAQICGEESFGTGSDHVREKDGIFAVLCWLSIVAVESEGKDKLVSVEEIVTNHWSKFGRNYFARYDYEEVETDAANAMMAALDDKMAEMNGSRTSPDEPMTLDPDFPTKVALANNFEYTDPVDESVTKGQGRRFVFTDGSRVIFRLSGTGSSGATIRLYVERYEPDQEKQGENAQEALKPFIEVALRVSKLKEFTGREKPTVIT